MPLCNEVVVVECMEFAIKIITPNYSHSTNARLQNMTTLNIAMRSMWTHINADMADWPTLIWCSENAHLETSFRSQKHMMLILSTSRRQFDLFRWIINEGYQKSYITILSNPDLSQGNLLYMHNLTFTVDDLKFRLNAFGFVTKRRTGFHINYWWF